MPPRPLTGESLGLFLELSLGITAWKEFQGTHWPLRSNPSSGNLHPTEGYVVLPPLAIKMEAEIESLGDETVELTFDDLGKFDASVVRQWDECVSLMLDLEEDEKYSLQEELEAFHRNRPRQGLALTVRPRQTGHFRFPLAYFHPRAAL